MKDFVAGVLQVQRCEQDLNVPILFHLFCRI